jgi:glycosyltransferase involved in cell wall biosynthesis
MVRARSAQPETAEAPSALVSLIMPVWRPRRDWLLAAVESALAQNGCELELIVIDDGCPEPVADLLAGVDDERMRIERVEHAGVSHARNTGFRASRGNWIRFVDCDDVLERESTAHLLTLGGNGVVIAYGATVLCDEDLRPAAKMTSNLQGRVVMDCLHDRFPITLPALLFPRWVVERVGDWDEEIVVCQDWDFFLRAFELAEVRGDDRTALRYRRHDDGASAGNSPESARAGDAGMWLVIDRYFERHPEQRGTAVEARARAAVHLVIARRHRAAYLAFLARAARGDPRRAAHELFVFARMLGSKLAKWTARRLVRQTAP